MLVKVHVCRLIMGFNVRKQCKGHFCRENKCFAVLRHVERKNWTTVHIDMKHGLYTSIANSF